MSDPIPADIRAELEQTPAWWQRQYDALVRKQIPRDAASHEGHDIAEPLRSWAGAVVAMSRCIRCGVTLDEVPDG